MSIGSGFSTYGAVFPNASGDSAGAQAFAAQQGLQGAQAGAAAQVASANAAAGATKQAAADQLAAVQAQLAQSQGRYNQIYPMLSGAYGQIASQNSSPTTAPSPPAMPSFGGGSVGNYGYGSQGGGGIEPARGVAPAQSGGGTPPPLSQSAFQPQTISPSSGPVVSPDLLNQQINAAQAQNSSSTAGQIRRQTNDLSGRGLGANSPLQQAIQAQLQGANLGANAQASLTAQNNAATQNANYALGMNQSQIQAAAAKYAAAQQAQASQFDALQAAGANEYGSQVGAQASEYGSQVGAQASEFGASAGANAQIQAAIRAAQANAYGSQLGYLGSTYGSGLDYQASLAQTRAGQQNNILNALSSFVNG